jgi:hypothetical protein
MTSAPLPNSSGACAIPCPICGAPLEWITTDPFWLPYFSCTRCLRSYELMRGRSLRACRCCGKDHAEDRVAATSVADREVRRS